MNAVMEREARFRAMFEATYPAVARYARHRGLSGHDADDLVAATYEVAWRRSVRDHALLQRLPAPGPAASPGEAASVSWRDIRRGLDELSPDDRELVLLIAWDGLSPSQAAEVLGGSAAPRRETEQMTSDRRSAS